MKKSILLLILMFSLSCMGKGDEYLMKTQKINKELMNCKDYCSSKELLMNFENTLNIVEDNVFQVKIENMRTKAYEVGSDVEWDKLDKYISLYMPSIEIVLGGEATYVSPNMKYFFEKSSPNSKENKFFALASKGGWYDRRGIVHGGLQYRTFPDWIYPQTGIEGKYDYGMAKEYLLKWQSLSSELDDVYLLIANNTIKKLQSICEKQK